MNYYLVDYENVKAHGLDGITSLDSSDVLGEFGLVVDAVGQVHFLYSLSI